MNFTSISHKKITVSTNIDAKSGEHGCVYTADEQTAGRGRLDHGWHARPGCNLLMSAVFEVAGMDAEHVSTFPLVAGCAVAHAARRLASSVLPRSAVKLKWPNDILLDGRKLAGILCERSGDKIICGIGVNVLETDFPPELRATATSFALEKIACTVTEVRDAVLLALADRYELWKAGTFTAVYPELEELDFLKGRTVEVVQTDHDAAPVVGICSGIAPCGALKVGGCLLSAGEAHVKSFGNRR